MQKAVIACGNGFNDRLAAAIVYKAYELERQYQASIFFHCKNNKIQGTDFLALVHLPIQKDDGIWISSTGQEADHAEKAMTQYLESICRETAITGSIINSSDLQEVKESLTVMLESIPSGICILDANGYITYANSAYRDSVAQSPCQVTGRHIKEFSPAGLYDEELFFGREILNFAIEIRDGTLAADISPIIVGGNFMGAILTIKDTQEVCNLREQLQSAFAKIEYLEKKFAQNREASWNSSRMKMESSKQKPARDKEAGWYSTENMKMESPEQAMVRRIKSGKAFEKFIGMNQKVLDALSIASKAAKVQSTVLIRGNSGTGKELVAEGIHQASSRSQGPFIRVNCSAIPESLLESEFFGYEKGAFTGAVKRKLGKFELAHRGTIFLDEIGEMEISMQTKLLRVLQSSQFERVGGEKTIEVDVRIIAATNRDIENMIEERTFREDLYYRLNVIPIYLPQLQERKEDIPLLVDYFLKKFSNQFGKQIAGIKKSAMDALIGYDWPGNVRELQNIMERMVVLTDGLYLELSDVPSYCNIQEKEKSTHLREFFIGSSLENDLFPLAEYEKQIIRIALEKYGSFTAAGKVLGITHKTVAAKAQKYGINKTDE